MNNVTQQGSSTGGAIPTIVQGASGDTPASHLPSGGGSIGGNPFDARLVTTEVNIGNLRIDVGKVEKDVKSHMWRGVTAVGAIFGVFGIGYMHLDTRINAISDAQIHATERIEDKVNRLDDKMDARLVRLDDRVQAYILKTSQAIPKTTK